MSEQIICEYCDNVFSNKSSVKAHQRRAQYCLKIQEDGNVKCNFNKVKSYDIENKSCVEYARNIFEAIVNEIGTSQFIQSENSINNARTYGLITIEDSVELSISLDNFIKLYYEYIDNVILLNKGSDFATGTQFDINSPKQWATVIRTVQRKASDIELSIKNVLEHKIRDIAGKQEYCKNKPLNSCNFPCKSKFGFFGNKCTYEQPK